MVKKAKNRYINKKKKRSFSFSKLMPGLLVIAGTAFGVYAFPFIEERLNQPVTRVIVDGDFVYLKKQEIVESVEIFSDDRLLDVDLEEIQNDLETLSWVYSAQVVRHWPDEVAITVYEQKPIARWNRSMLLNQYGELFSRGDKVVQGLPGMFGPEGKQLQMMERFLDIGSMIRHLGLQIADLHLDAKGSWEVVMTNDLRVILGNEDVLQRIKRFVVLYESGVPFMKVASIDLRYSNGAAVKWHEGVQEEQLALRY